MRPSRNPRTVRERCNTGYDSIFRIEATSVTSVSHLNDEDQLSNSDTCKNTDSLMLPRGRVPCLKIQKAMIQIASQKEPG